MATAKIKQVGKSLQLVIDLDHKALLNIAENDKSALEDHIERQIDDGGDKAPSAEVMLANPMYLANLKTRLTKLVTENINMFSEDAPPSEKEMKSIFKVEIKMAIDATKKEKAERDAAFKKQEPHLLTTLQVSVHDAHKVRMYLQRSRLNYREVEVEEPKPAAVPTIKGLVAGDAKTPAKPTKAQIAKDAKEKKLTRA